MPDAARGRRGRIPDAAQDWEAEGEILFDHLSYCPDTTNTSDHRPILARFEVEGTGTGTGTDDFARKKAEILDKIQELEQELGALRALVAGLSCRGS